MQQGAFDLPYSNQLPSEADAARAHTILRTLQVELRQIDTELMLLLAKRARLLHQSLWCKTVLAPHKKLPLELIKEIISAWSLMSPIKALPSDKDEPDPRLVMTQICSSWREAAFDIPDLWKVTFSCNDPPQSSVHLANSWLNHCSSHSLFLKTRRLSSSLTSLWISRANFVLTNLILPHSRRITTLDLDIDVVQWNMVRSYPFDRLTTLYLPPKVVSGTERPDGLVSCPSLHSVHVQGIGNLDDVLFLPSLPWAQLTNLSLSGHFPIANIPQFLTQCISLQHLEINRIALGPIVSLTDIPIHLPWLESLSIVFASPFLFDLLSLLRSPRISSIKLDTLPKNEEAVSKFTRFISSISDTLQHFQIARAGWHGSIRQEYISPMTSLTHFVVPYGHFFTSDMLALIGRRDLLPNIKYLGFSVNHNAGNVVDMLETRCTHDALAMQDSNLERVDILSHGVQWEDKGYSRLQMLRSRGMVVNITHSRL